MKATKINNTFSVSELTEHELDVIFAVVYTANKRCFNVQDESGKWLSNDDFILSLDNTQREALKNLGETIENKYYN